LTKGANVLLLDESNFQRYKRGDRCQYRGGLARKSPVRIQIPHAGRWHGVVDMRGLRGSTNAGFRVINGSALRPLPPIREHRAEIQQIVNNFVESVMTRWLCAQPTMESKRLLTKLQK